MKQKSEGAGVLLLAKNRRWVRLQQLIEQGDYFSEAEIRMRHPLLYQLYVGQYKRGGKAEGGGGVSMASVLMEQMDKDSFEDALEASKAKYFQETGKLISFQQGKSISEKQLEENEDLLIRMAHEAFLRGEDKEIDYAAIDQNEEYDGPLRAQDEEDQYFDQEDWGQDQDGQYTGELDY